jgi:Bacterial Ig-like domain (group 3)/Glycine rich protein
MPGDHIFKRSSLLREAFACFGVILISAALLMGSSVASGHTAVQPQNASEPTPGSLVTETYEFTGEPGSFTVPAGVQAIGVKALGAAGGYGGISVEPVRDTVTKPGVSAAMTLANTPEGSFAPGGGGGEVEASVPVSPGQTLTLDVGGAGTSAQSPERRGFPTVQLPADLPPSVVVASGAPGAPGGYNGGGEGGGSEYFYRGGSTFLFFGGGGGGASTLSLASVPLIVAGGGGGGGANRGERSTRGAPGVVLGDTVKPQALSPAGKQVVAAPPAESTLPSSGGNGGGSIAQGGDGESGAAGSAAGGAGGSESTPGSARETGGAGQGDNSTDDPDDEGGFTGGGGGGGYYGGVGGSFGICLEACEEARGGGGGGGSNYATPNASEVSLARGTRSEGDDGLITLSYFAPYPTSTQATPTPETASTGETVTLTGTVEAEVSCEGTIEFLLDGVPTGAPIPIDSNSAQTTITAPPAGNHKIIAIYSGVPSTSNGPGCLTSESEPSTLTTTSPYPTTTTATPAPSKASTGETVMITGTVTASGSCEGTIEFLLDGIATGPPIQVSSNSAQTTITAPPPGNHKIIAIYSGAPTTSSSPGCLPSRSEPTSLTTTEPFPTTTTATPTPSRASTGETVTLTGTVTASGSCEGTIEFLLDGIATGPPIQVSSNSAQTTITAPPPGNHKIIAIYSGAPTTSSSPGCLPSRSEPTSLTTTEPFPTTTTATPTPSRANVGETVTITGTVKAGGPCAGTIEFQLDGAPIGAPVPVNANSAQTTITAPPAGSHQIVAIYSGAPTTAASTGCLPSRSEPTTLTTAAAPLTNAEALVPIKKALACQSARHFAIHLQLPRRLKLLGAAVYIDGKFVKHLGQNTRVYKLNLRGRPYATITITLSAREPDGSTVSGQRIYHTCRGHRLPAHTKFKI